MGSHLLDFASYIRKIGGKAHATAPTPDANGNIEAWIDESGILHVSVDNVISGTALPNGQAVMASSVPVTMASNQSPMPFYQAGTAVVGTDAQAGATTDKQLIADPGAGVAVYVTGLVIQNTGATTDTFQLEADTATAKTAIGPLFTVTAGVLLNVVFGSPGLPFTVHKNMGYTSTGTAAYVICANGLSR